MEHDRGRSPGRIKRGDVGTIGMLYPWGLVCVVWDRFPRRLCECDVVEVRKVDE